VVDLHTASFGRINSYYVRADLNDPDANALASLLKPQIILHDAGHGGTLRGAATKLGIKAITVEIGNPQLLQVRLCRSLHILLQKGSGTYAGVCRRDQNQFIQWTSSGILNVLDHFNMYSRTLEEVRFFSTRAS
jgi:hypothetical protein